MVRRVILMLLLTPHVSSSAGDGILARDTRQGGSRGLLAGRPGVV